METEKIDVYAVPQIQRNVAKRLFDIIFSFLALTLGLPLFVCLALLIRMGSRGPIVYSHQRVGRAGKIFPCYKFRTMWPDAAERLAELLAARPDLRIEWEESHKLKNDPRVTPLGAFLRKTSLDELPQFWNVLLGHLSVVGPRPLVRQEVEERLGEHAHTILAVRPGLTGLWQTSGRSSLSYAERIQLDLAYVETRSFWSDLLLIAKTIPVMLFTRGAC